MEKVAYFLGIFAFAFFEKWLANNPKIKDNSTVDLILTFLKGSKK